MPVRHRAPASLGLHGAPRVQATALLTSLGLRRAPQHPLASTSGVRHRRCSSRPRRLLHRTWNLNPGQCPARGDFGSSYDARSGHRSARSLYPGSALCVAPVKRPRILRAVPCVWHCRSVLGCLSKPPHCPAPLVDRRAKTKKWFWPTAPFALYILLYAGSPPVSTLECAWHQTAIPRSGRGPCLCCVVLLNGYCWAALRIG
jgi:hypothetical protein